MSESKRVLFIITQAEFGGAQRFIYNLLSRLDRSRFAPSVIVGQTSGTDFLVEKLGELGISAVQFSLLTRAGNWWNDLRALVALRRLIKNARPSTIFLLSSKAGFLGSLAARFMFHVSRPKVIYRIGGWTFNDPWPAWRKVYYRWLEKLSARWKDIIIVNNQNDYEQARQLGIRPRETLLLIPNGLDPYKIAFLSREEARTKLLKKISANIWIGTIANHYPAKGLEYLLTAAEHFKQQDNIIFIIIGDGPEHNNLKLKIENLKLRGKVFLLGQLPDAQQYLPAFDIFVLPSLKEGFPWTLLEAMAAKLPIIATAVGAVPEFVHDGQNGLLIAPGNVEQIVGRIRSLLTDELKRQQLGIAAHQTLLLQFSIEKMVSRIEAIL